MASWPAHFDVFPNSLEGKKAWFGNSQHFNFNNWRNAVGQKPDEWSNLELVLRTITGFQKRDLEDIVYSVFDRVLDRDVVLAPRYILSKDKTVEPAKAVAAELVRLMEGEWKEEAAVWLEEVSKLESSRFGALWKRRAKNSSKKRSHTATQQQQPVASTHHQSVPSGGNQLTSLEQYQPVPLVKEQTSLGQTSLPEHPLSSFASFHNHMPAFSQQYSNIQTQSIGFDRPQSTPPKTPKRQRQEEVDNPLPGYQSPTPSTIKRRRTNDQINQSPSFVSSSSRSPFSSQEMLAPSVRRDSPPQMSPSPYSIAIPPYQFAAVPQIPRLAPSRPSFTPSDDNWCEKIIVVNKYTADNVLTDEWTTLSVSMIIKDDVLMKEKIEKIRIRNVSFEKFKRMQKALDNSFDIEGGKMELKWVGINGEEEVVRSEGMFHYVLTNMSNENPMKLRGISVRTAV